VVAKGRKLEEWSRKRMERYSNKSR